MPFAFDGFVNREEAGRAGLEGDNIFNPYELWNSRMPRSGYAIFYLPEDLKRIEEIRDLPRYRELESDPRFVKKPLSCGN